MKDQIARDRLYEIAKRIGYVDIIWTGFPNSQNIFAPYWPNDIRKEIEVLKDKMSALIDYLNVDLKLAPKIEAHLIAKKKGKS